MDMASTDALLAVAMNRKQRLEAAGGVHADALDLAAPPTPTPPHAPPHAPTPPRPCLPPPP